MSNKNNESTEVSQKVFLVGRKAPVVPEYNAERQIIGELYYNRQIELMENQIKSRRSEPKWLKGGEIIKIIRIRLNVSQSQFSKLIHVAHTTISTWETGHNRPPRLSLLGLKYILPPDVGVLINLEDFGYVTDKHHV